MLKSLRDLCKKLSAFSFYLLPPKRTILLVFTIYFLPSTAQVAGLSALSVLDMPASARSAAFGFDYLSLYDDDVTLTLNNPSLISDRHDRRFSVGYMNLFAGAGFGSVAYSRNFQHLGAFTFGLMFDSYGRFDGYDEADNPTGTFTAADYVFSIGWGRMIDEHVSIGASFKPVLSHYADYTAVAFGIDLAATYMSLNRAFSATFMGRNIGAQVVPLYGTTERLPFELSVSGSYKLQDAPFRFLFALTDLQTWDLTYEDPLNPTTTTDPFTGEVSGPTPVAAFADKLFRHFNAGVELGIKQAVFVRVGYSYRQMVEMTAADVFNLSGFSVGFGIHAKKFDFAFSRNGYHLTQAANYIGLTMKL